MNTSKLFIYGIVLVLALFLQSCKSDSKETQATTNTATPTQQVQKQARTAAPTAVKRDTLDAATNAKIQKVIEQTNRKIDQTDKEVDKLLEGI